MPIYTRRDPQRPLTVIDSRNYDTLEEAHEAAFAAVGKAYGVSWHEFGESFCGKIIIKPDMIFIPDDPEFPPYCWGYRFKLGEVLVLVNTDDGSSGNTEVVYVPYKMVSHWPNCLEPMGFKNNMEDEPQTHTAGVILNESQENSNLRRQPYLRHQGRSLSSRKGCYRQTLRRRRP